MRCREYFFCRNISIENVTAFGGEYGIFLEAFSEVPIEGLVLKNIYIEGTEKTLYGKNWKDPLIDNLVINGKSFPNVVGKDVFLFLYNNSIITYFI